MHSIGKQYKCLELNLEVDAASVKYMYYRLPECELQVLGPSSTRNGSLMQFSRSKCTRKGDEIVPIFPDYQKIRRKQQLEIRNHNC